MSTALRVLASDSPNSRNTVTRPLSCSYVVRGAKTFQVPVKKSFSFVDDFAEGFAAVLFDEAVGIFAVRNRDNANGQARREQRIERTHGGVLARVVRIETEHDFLDVTFEDARVVGGERRALRRDDVLHAGHEARDQIELPFADDGGPGVEQRRAWIYRGRRKLCPW